MDTRQIKYFIALFEEQSITKAARRLHVVQPAVSMQLRKLETDFGVTLFERTPHGLTPSTIARGLYPVCLEIAADLHRAEQLLRDSAGAVSGSINVGVLPSVAQSLLGEALLDYTRLYPHVVVRCYEGYSGNVSGWLAQGALDFAIVTVMEGESRLRLRPLITEDLMAVAGRSTELGGGPSIRGEDLLKLRLVLPSGRNSLRVLIDTEFERLGMTVAAALEVDSLATVFKVLESPGWVSILPEIALRDRQVGERFGWRRLVEPSIRRSLAIAFQPGREPSLAGQKFIDTLEQTIKQAADTPPPSPPPLSPPPPSPTATAPTATARRARRSPVHSG